MDSQDHTNTQHSPGGKSHGAQVCTKCGWNYPNPHPSAKNRRAHKKVCGTIKGFEILDTEKEKQNLDLQEERCLSDEHKLPSPRVVEKADERIGDISEEDVFADAVCEFSSSIGSDSFKEKEATATNCMAKSAENPGETQHCDITPEVIQESCEVPPVKVLENLPSLVEGASENRQGGEPSTEGQNMAFETPNDSSASALRKRKDTFDSSWNDEVIYSDVEGPHGFAFEEMSMINPGEADYTASDNVPVNTSPVVTNADQVISTSQSAPGGIPFTENADVSLHGTKGLEEFKLDHSVNPCFPATPKGEECETDTLTRSENVGIQPEGLSIGTEVPLSDKLPLEDKTEPQGQTSLVAVKEFPSAEDIVMSKIDPEIKMKDEEGVSSLGSALETLESETSRASLPVVDPIVADVSHSDLTGHEGELIQANVVAEENTPNSKLSSESSCANDQRKSSPETSPNTPQIGTEACESNNDVSHAADNSAVVDLIVHESDLIQANVVADENSPSSKLSSDSSCATVQRKSSPEASQSILQIGAEACKSNNYVSHAANKTGVVDVVVHERGLVQADVVVEENSPNSKLSSESSCAVEHCASPVSVVLKGDDPSKQEKGNDEECRESSKWEVFEESTTRDDSAKTANQKLLESGRTEFNRVVGGLGVIQANEIDGNVKAHNFYAEVPVTIESNDHRDFGRLQNLSEAHIRSLVSSPLVTRDNTSNAFESNLRSTSGLSDEDNKPENGSQSSSLAVALSKNQEITMEKTTSWSSVKEQHVPLKNLLSEARSPRLAAAEAKKDHESNIPRVSSILDQETSPEDGRWPERREVSEEWNSPAKYPVDLKREERKVKGRPFWVPFVCCSSVK